MSVGRDEPTSWYDYGGVKLMPMHFAGHALYCRKCRPGDAVDGLEHIRALNGIVLPETTGNRSQWVEILAVGPNVGKSCSNQHARRLRPDWVEKHGVKEARRSNVPREIVGRLAYIPVNDDPRIHQSIMSRDEVFIEESLPAAILEAQG